MVSNSQIRFDKDVKGKQITVIRNFDAPLEHVWRAWTEGDLLDQWWAPKPWRTETKTMDFREGGHWMYAMVGPDHSKQWCMGDYFKIVPNKSFEGADYFVHEDGVRNTDLPGMNWNVQFNESGSGTEVKVLITFDSEEDLQKIVEMGFEAGFTSALENLDQYFEAKFKLRSELKSDYAPRVSTYLNFPGTTEEAFNFYRSIFGTEFSGKGIQRFGDIPAEPGNPPVIDSVKKMVLHVELPILGGHVLMATDSPKEMGFDLTQGTNMHICLEPETRKETKRLFDALSRGGNVTMPLEDMFFGAYFGTCTDKFGINWMFNCFEKNN